MAPLSFSVSVSEWWLAVMLLSAVAAAMLYPLRARTVKGFPSAGPFSKLTQPFFGSLLYVSLHFHRYHDMIREVAQRFDEECWTAGIAGNPAFIYLGARPDLLEHVLRREFWKYEKGRFFKSTMQALLGQGIFNVDGEEWQKQRKVASHLFTARSLKEDMSCVFLKNAHVVLGKLGAAASSERVFDVQDLYFRFTLDSFSEIAFGEGAGCLSDGAPVPFAVAFDRVQRLCNARFFVPDFVWKLQRALRLPFGSESQIRRDIGVIRDYGFGVIERARQRRATDQSERPDLISRFIDEAEKRGEKSSNAELLDVVLNFIIAGRDTTACLLSWATYELTQQPAWQARLYDECRGLDLADEAGSGLALRGGGGELPLLRAFLLETLRLHPPVPQDVKECVVDDLWPDGRRVPSGTMVIYSPYLMGRSVKLWGADAGLFRPERWMDPSSGLLNKEPSQYAFPVFNAGPRLCLGKQVAILESSTMLSMAIQKFEFSCVDSDVSYAMSVTMPIKDGLRVRVKARAE